MTKYEDFCHGLVLTNGTVFRYTNSGMYFYCYVQHDRNVIPICLGTSK